MGDAHCNLGDGWSNGSIDYSLMLPAGARPAARIGQLHQPMWLEWAGGALLYCSPVASPWNQMFSLFRSTSETITAVTVCSNPPPSWYQQVSDQSLKGLQLISKPHDPTYQLFHGRQLNSFTHVAEDPVFIPLLSTQSLFHLTCVHRKQSGGLSYTVPGSSDQHQGTCILRTQQYWGFWRHYMPYLT